MEKKNQTVIENKVKDLGEKPQEYDVVKVVVDDKVHGKNTVDVTGGATIGAVLVPSPDGEGEGCQTFALGQVSQQTLYVLLEATISMVVFHMKETGQPAHLVLDNIGTAVNSAMTENFDPMEIMMATVLNMAKMKAKKEANPLADIFKNL